MYSNVVTAIDKILHSYYVSTGRVTGTYQWRSVYVSGRCGTEVGLTMFLGWVLLGRVCFYFV